MGSHHIKEIYAALSKVAATPVLYAREVEYITEELLGYLLPERAVNQGSERGFATTIEELTAIVAELTENKDEVMASFLDALPSISEAVRKDIQAAYMGDPAAKSEEEVRCCYPSVFAVATYRMAHVFEVASVPFLPRAMTEWAHRQTGIDIHPGARIAPGLFIDHGTGVVIGETVIIEEGVKLYQGVTLGAKSFPLDDDGLPMKGIQRHPKVEKNVIIYANTTILGGETVIGAGSEIAASLFITESIPPNSLVVGPSLQGDRSYRVLDKRAKS